MKLLSPHFRQESTSDSMTLQKFKYKLLITFTN